MVAFVSGLQWVTSRVNDPVLESLKFSGFDDGTIFHANPNCPKVSRKAQPRTECFNILKNESFCAECSRAFLQDRKLWKIISEVSFLRHYWNLRDYTKVAYQQLSTSEKLAISERKSSLEDDLLFVQKENEDRSFILETYFQATLTRLESNIETLASWENSEPQKELVLSEFKILPCKGWYWWIGETSRKHWEDYRLFALAKAFSVFTSEDVSLFQAPFEVYQRLGLEGMVPLDPSFTPEVLETAVQLAKTGGVYLDTSSVLAAAKQLV